MAMNGELLQAANYLCNMGLTFLSKLQTEMATTHVTLPPCLPVTLRLKPFLSLYLTGRAIVKASLSGDNMKKTGVLALLPTTAHQRRPRFKAPRRNHAND